jgi:hypothetical protein
MGTVTDIRSCRSATSIATIILNYRIAPKEAGEFTNYLPRCNTVNSLRLFTACPLKSRQTSMLQAGIEPETRVCKGRAGSVATTGMRHITKFRSTTGRIHDGGPIILYYNTYHFVTATYSIHYSNMLYRFVA